jgi:16S rRNA (guanine966-N2)-methyltransferase
MTGSGQIRIIGGQWRGRKVPVATAPGLRPTPDRVRETLFNWLGQTIPGWRCLDLFAGSGALGLEALSRGAGEVVFVEKNPATAKQLKAVLSHLGSEQGRVQVADAARYLAGPVGPFNLVFLDPPFADGGVEPWLLRLVPHLAPGARVYCESSTPVSELGPWQVIRSGRAGQVSYQLLELAGENPT